ncbi:MAG: hypothetical protein JXA03_10140 [Bacteroidales bacterium]|nr:hypothetical protein [Bacteroidales bacterium]
MNTKEALEKAAEFRVKADALFAGTVGKWVSDELEKHKNIIGSYYDLVGKYDEKNRELLDKKNLSGLISLRRSLRDNVLTILEKGLPLIPGKHIEEALNSFLETSFEMTDEFPDTRHEVQMPVCFLSASGDSFPVRMLLRGKRILFGIHCFFYPVEKLFRKLAGRKYAPKPVWKRHVPLRSLIYRHLILERLDNVLEEIDAVYLRIAEVYSSLWQEDDKLAEEQYAQINKLPDGSLPFGDVIVNTMPGNEAGLIETLEGCKENITRAFTGSAAESTELMEQRVLIAGTVKHPAKMYNIQRVGEYTGKIKKRYIRRITDWNRTLFVLGEDWKISVEVFACKFHVYKEYYDLSDGLFRKLIQPVGERLDLMGKRIEESGIEIMDQQSAVLNAGLMEGLRGMKLKIKQSLQLKEVPAINEIIESSDFPGLIEKAESAIRQRIEMLSQKRSFVKSALLDHPVSENEVETISPYGLVSFEMAPGLLVHFPKLKSNFIGFIQALQVEIGQIPDIVDFSIDSALSFMENTGDVEKGYKITGEGYQRALETLKEAGAKQEEFFKKEDNSLFDAAQKFNDDIHELTDNENVFQIKFRITRARAIEKSKQIRNEIGKKIRHLVPLLVIEIRKMFGYISDSTHKLRKHFEVEGGAGYISTDVSDYLTETEIAIQRLPFVYQRLFRIEPLDSFEFYIDRESSFQKLGLAYGRWKEGKFAPVAIIGERGSGKTTLLRRFVKENAPVEKIEILDLHGFPQDPEKIFKSIEDLAKTNKTAMVDKNGVHAANRRMIAVDGLEKLFLGYVGGFYHLRKTMELISLTSHEIFWICICHEYSWKFLDRSVSISDYFGYHIKLSELQVSDIRKIIEKRHSYSGYKLEFPPPVKEKTLLWFRKNPQVDPAEYNRSRFFEKLYSFSRANIAIALLLWLRSTAKVEDNTFHLEPIENLNFAFIRYVTPSKMPMLRAMIIHNGLTPMNFSMIFRLSEDETLLRLYQLKDDGLLVEKDGVYNVNPLIYSPLIKYLLDLNLLH